MPIIVIHKICGDHILTFGLWYYDRRLGARWETRRGLRYGVFDGFRGRTRWMMYCLYLMYYIRRRIWHKGRMPCALCTHRDRLVSQKEKNKILMKMSATSWYVNV